MHPGNNVSSFCAKLSPQYLLKQTCFGKTYRGNTKFIPAFLHGVRKRRYRAVIEYGFSQSGYLFRSVSCFESKVLKRGYDLHGSRFLGAPFVAVVASGALPYDRIFPDQFIRNTKKSAKNYLSGVEIAETQRCWTFLHACAALIAVIEISCLFYSIQLFCKIRVGPYQDGGPPWFKTKRKLSSV